MPLETFYASIDSYRHDLYRGTVDVDRLAAAMGDAGVTLKNVSDQAQPAHYRARVAREYGAQALRALDALAAAGKWDAAPAVQRLPQMCPEPDTSWRESDDPEAAWVELALEQHAKLSGLPPEHQGRPLCRLVGLTAAVLDWYAQQGVSPS